MYASLWGHIISKEKSLVDTTYKAQNSPTLTQLHNGSLHAK